MMRSVENRGSRMEVWRQRPAVPQSLTLGELQKLRDSQLDDRAQAIHDLAAAQLAAHPTDLADYGLTAAKLTDLQSAITAYSATVGTPRAAVAIRKSATDAIPGMWLAGRYSRAVLRLGILFYTPVESCMICMI